MADYSVISVQQYKDNGINIYELSEDERAEWKKFYSEIEASYLKDKNNPI